MPSRNSATRTVVRVSYDAFLSMCFASADAAVVAPDFNSASYKLLAAWEKKRGAAPIRKGPIPPSLIFSETGHETAGVLFGDVRRTKNQTVISVECALVTTSVSSDDGVMQSGASALLLTDLAEAARAPFGTPVACFHSHPMLAASPREVVEQQLYGPSEEDLEGPAYPNCAVSLIVTMAWPEKSKSRPADQTGLVCRRIGDFNFFLTGHLPSARSWSASDPSLEIRIAD